MKQYKYKIQWLIDKDKIIKGVGIKHLINILGVRSLDVINFRDYDFKIVNNYNGFIQYPYGVAEIETLKYIKKQLKNNKNIEYVELLRR